MPSKKPKYEQISMICTLCNGTGRSNPPLDSMTLFPMCGKCNGTGINPIEEPKTLLEAERIDDRQLLVDRPEVGVQ